MKIIRIQGSTEYSPFFLFEIIYRVGSTIIELNEYQVSLLPCCGYCSVVALFNCCWMDTKCIQDYKLLRIGIIHEVVGYPIKLLLSFHIPFPWRFVWNSAEYYAMAIWIYIGCFIFLLLVHLHQTGWVVLSSLLLAHQVFVTCCTAATRTMSRFFLVSRFHFKLCQHK